MRATTSALARTRRKRNESESRDLRALGATDPAKAGKKLEKIQARLTHTSSKTSEIYIKEAFPDVSELDLPLP